MRDLLLRIQEAKKPPKGVAATGDCYEASFNWIYDNCLSFAATRKGDSGIYLVHGEVRGSPGSPIEGIRYGHAWIEDGEQVHDVANGKSVTLPKMVYYGLGGVYPDRPPFKPNLHHYTPEEARRMILQFGHYGPWELETESGL